MALKYNSQSSDQKFMLRNLFLFIISSIFISNAYAKDDIRTQVLKLIPKEIAELTPEETRESIEKKFAKKISNNKDPETLYLNYFDEKNDVSIGTKNGKFSYVYLELPRITFHTNKNLYKFVLDHLDPKQKKDIAEENEKKTSHEAGRLIIIDLPEEGLKLEFANNDKKPLYSVIIYPQKKR